MKTLILAVLISSPAFATLSVQSLKACSFSDTGDFHYFHGSETGKHHGDVYIFNAGNAYRVALPSITPFSIPMIAKTQCFNSTERDDAKDCKPTTRPVVKLDGDVGLNEVYEALMADYMTLGNGLMDNDGEDTADSGANSSQKCDAAAILTRFKSCNEISPLTPAARAARESVRTQMTILASQYKLDPEDPTCSKKATASAKKPDATKDSLR